MAKVVRNSFHGVAVALVLGMTLSGCGGGSGGGAGATSVAPSAAKGGGAQPSEAGSAPLRYSQCMRANGVPSFPDPVNGRLMLRATKGGPLDPSDPHFQAAQQVCKALAPAGVGGGSDPAQQAQMLKYVACMRKNGVPKFPDPAADGRMMFQPGSGVDPNSPAFQSAEAKCADLMPGGAVGGGTK